MGHAINIGTGIKDSKDRKKLEKQILRGAREFAKINVDRGENLLKDKIKNSTEKILKYNSVKLLKSTGKSTKFKIGNRTFLFVVDFDNFGVLKTQYGKYYEILGNDKGKLKLRRVMIANNPNELIINKEKHGQTYLEMSRILREKLSKINLPKLLSAVDDILNKSQ